MAIYWDTAEHEYKHWCGNCQIRIYIQRHYGRILTWGDCPYTCEYATEMRRSIEAKGETMSRYDRNDYDDFMYDLEEFLKGHEVSELLKLVTAAVEDVEYERKENG